MTAMLLSGKDLAKSLRAQLKTEISELIPVLGRKPHLAVVLVGDNPASQVYVRTKTKQAHSIGIDTTDVVLPGDVTDEQLQDRLRDLSSQSSILDGILLQLPLPGGLDELAALMCIEPGLDVDGLHPLNQGLLMRGAKRYAGGGLGGYRPCTPLGIMKLIDYAREELDLSVQLDGLKAIVVGRSVLVGKPVASMLLERNCTVAVCHSRTKELQTECARADILVAAVGRPGMIQIDWVKPGAIVIDVGINRTESGKLVGDVEFDSVAQIASAITPVPGGVGPMTIAMLLANTVESARRKI